MNDQKKSEEAVEPKSDAAKIEKKIPVIIELGDSNLDDVAGGAMAYRCSSDSAN